jgi:hypothetical protein
MTLLFPASNDGVVQIVACAALSPKPRTAAHHPKSPSQESVAPSATAEHLRRYP